MEGGRGWEGGREVEGGGVVQGGSWEGGWRGGRRGGGQACGGGVRGGRMSGRGGGARVETDNKTLSRISSKNLVEKKLIFEVHILLDVNAVGACWSGGSPHDIGGDGSPHGWQR